LLVAEAAPLSDLLAGWGDKFEAALVAKLLWRLGVAARDEDSDRALAKALVEALHTKSATIDRVFFDWRGGRDPGAESYPSEQFRTLAALLSGRERPSAHTYWSDQEPCSMHIDEVESIWDAIAERDDWAPFEGKIAAVRRMGDAMIEHGPAPA
jgi:hypothetical protein